MANQEHVTILRQGVEVWNEWRKENLEVKPDFSGADFSGADFSGADLGGADFGGADLGDAYLHGAYLRYANLRGANLHGASLSGADLHGADFSDADLGDADLPPYQICPPEGEFIAYKKVNSGDVIKLRIPENARRTSSLVGRKCRAEFVWVVSGGGVSERGGRYTEGEIYTPNLYDDDPRVECTHGVHFFMTYKEAEEYQ